MADLSLITPGGRLIEGSMSVPSLKDYEGNLRAKPQYYFALAVDKRDPSVLAVMGQIYQNAITFYSQVPDVVRRIQMQLDPYSRFAWKMVDGDHPKFADKPLYKGMYVFKFSSTYPLKTCLPDNSLIEPATVKLGWYADVAFTVRPNGRIDGNAGMFMNPQMTRILGSGQEIVVGPAPEKLFANAPVAAMGAPLPPAGAPQGFGPAPQGFGPPPVQPGNAYVGHAGAPTGQGFGGTSYPTTPTHTAPMSAPGVAPNSMQFQGTPNPNNAGYQGFTQPQAYEGFFPAPAGAPQGFGPSPSNPIPGHPDGERGLMPLLNALAGAPQGFGPAPAGIHPDAALMTLAPLAPPANGQGVQGGATSGAAQGFTNSANSPSPSATVSPSDDMPSLPGFADGQVE